jgi:hypothetical protein
LESKKVVREKVPEENIREHILARRNVYNVAAVTVVDCIDHCLQLLWFPII